MPVPKRKSPQSATRKRVASAWTLKASGVVKVPHIVCSSCGHYKGRQAIDVE